MGFEFDERTEVEISGKRYQFDTTDAAFVEGVMTNLPRLLDARQRYQDVLASLTRENAGGVEAALGVLRSANEQVIQSARQFLVCALGQQAYAEIFQDRQESAGDHIKLCTYLYDTAVNARVRVVSAALKRSESRVQRPAGGE